MIRHIYSKGQVTLGGSVILAVLTMAGGIYTAKLTADTTITDKIAQVNTAAAVVTRTVDLNDKNTTARLDRLENKIDWLIQQQGGIPSQIVKSAVINSK